MSEREKVLSMLAHVPDYKMGYVLAYVEGLTADEAADDAFCAQLAADYENDPDPDKDREYPLEACKREWGLA